MAGELKTIFWEKVKDERLNRGLSYSDIAEKMGKTDTYVTTIFSEEKNIGMRIIFSLLGALDMTLEQALGSKVGKQLRTTKDTTRSYTELWNYLDNLYPDLKPMSSRRKAIISLGYWWGRYPENGLIALTLNKLDKISRDLKIAPLQLISSRKSRESAYQKQNGLVNIEVRHGRETIVSLMLDGDSTRTKIEDWLMALSVW